MAVAARAKEVKVLFAEAREGGSGDLELDGFRVPEAPIVGEITHVVVAHFAAVAEPLAARVARDGGDLRGRALERRHLLTDEFMLDMPEASGAKIHLHSVRRKRGWRRHLRDAGRRRETEHVAPGELRDGVRVARGDGAGEHQEGGSSAHRCEIGFHERKDREP